MGTAVTGSVVVAVIVLIVRKMVKDKKAGKSIQCGCGCSHCTGHCETKEEDRA